MAENLAPKQKSPESTPSVATPLLLSAVRSLIEGHSGIQILLFATDREAAQGFDELSKMAPPERFDGGAFFFPGFLQSGVYRFESARKALGARLGALEAIRTGRARVIVASARAVARFVPDLDWLAKHRFELRKGGDLELEEFLSHLEKIGYLRVQSVSEVGDFAVRGGIVDFWSPGQRFPCRVEVFGDSVEDIRLFRPVDGRSFETQESLGVLPCREFHWPTDQGLELSLQRLHDHSLAQRIPGNVRADLFENLRQGVPFSGIDDACGLLFPDHLTTFFKFVSARYPQSPRLQICASKEAIRTSLLEDYRLFEKAEQSAQYKSYLFTPFPLVFSGMSLEHQSAGETGLEPLFESCTVDTVQFGQLPESLRAQFSRPECSKASGRLDTLRSYLNSQFENSDVPVSQIHIGLRHGGSLGEFVGFLRRSFSEVTLDGDAVEESVPSGIDPEFFRQTPVVKDLKPRLFWGDLSDPLYSTKSQILVVSESWLRGHSHAALASEIPASGQSRTQSSQSNAEILMQAQYSDFRENDLVVHVQHGVGRFLGLATVKIADASGDFLVVEYAGQDKIYVPIDKLNLVHRYLGGDGSSVTLDSLKSQTWEKKRERARKDAEKMARELMENQARRLAASGHAFGRNDDEMMNFEAAFPFDETPDQIKALREITEDMVSEESMDRLLCGDVGFGKTEVALRAAYRAVLDGMQVAWLVPTTVLAHQHFRSATERFEGFGVRVALLDRGAATKATRQTLLDLAQGKVDVLIGTHRILSSDVKFRNLGLLVVDEEQRFGVVQKERIKAMSYGVDVLTMTATPIPRTLQMAMLGMRDLSLLTTPPKSRLAVSTFVSPFDEDTIRYALSSEMSRGGQSFYVHNRVEDLEAVKLFLEKVIPGVRVAVGHGQMDQGDLDKIMLAFLDGRYDVLLCTTIIESGIDMPNVNTIIVQDADRFGLAQLYQLRGRVGRRSKRGYAYLMLSPGLTEKDEGYKRVQIIKEHQDLGSGFVIASHDLEMRGGGNILGDSQSGHMSDVGLESYNQMLTEAIQALKGVPARKLVDVDLRLPVEIRIPESYIESPRERLRYYRKMFSCGTEEALIDLLDSFKDLYGEIPFEVKLLAQTARVKRLAARIGALSIAVGSASTEIRLGPEVLQGGSEHEKLVLRILDVCNKNSQGIRLTPDGRILVNYLRAMNFKGDEVEKAFTQLQGLLSQLAAD